MASVPLGIVGAQHLRPTTDGVAAVKVATDLDGKSSARAPARLLLDLKYHTVVANGVVLAHRPHDLLEEDLVQVNRAELHESPGRIRRLLANSSL